MLSRAVDAQKMIFQYTRTGATKIIPPSSLDSPFSIIVQLYYNKLVVCYLCFMTSSYLSTLHHHVVKQMSKQYCLYISYDALLRVKCKKENSFRQSRTAGWQMNVLGLFCMGFIAYKSRPISFSLMNLHIICTNTLVGDHLVLKWTLF